MLRTEILRKYISDPLIEGLDTWGVKELFAKQLQSKKLSPLLCKLSVMKGYFQEFPLSLQLLFRSELFTVFADTMMRILMVTTMEMKSGR